MKRTGEMPKEVSCPKCGKRIDLVEGDAYYVALDEFAPVKDGYHGPTWWVSDFYCSIKCMRQSVEHIRRQLMTWFYEQGEKPLEVFRRNQYP